MIRNKWDREINNQAHGKQAGTVTRYPRFALAEPASLSRVLLKYWSWILLTTLAVTAGATAVAEMQTPIYKAQAEVAVYPTSLAGGSALQPFVMGTEKGIATSGALLSIVSQSMFIPESTLQHGLSVSIPVDADLLVISFSDPDPLMAQNVANAVAEAYVAYGSSKALPTASGRGSATTSPAGTVQAAVITYAGLPTSPVSPNRRLIIGVALILGLALGIGLALLRDQVDDSLRGPLDLETQANSPVLAQIPAVDRKRRSLADGLHIVRHPTTPIADAYRDLRTRVMQVAAWRRTNLLLVTSPGREDKASVAANLAAALALSGLKVVLVGADLRWGRTDALFGLDNQPGLASLVHGGAKIAETLHRTDVPGLVVLPGGPGAFDPSTVLQSTAFSNVLVQLRSEADFVVIEAPPVLASADTAALAELGGLILLVADARASTRAEVRAATHQLAHVRDDLIGCVLDNTGRARRLPAASIAAARKTINERANSESSLPGVSAVTARPEPDREPAAASIQGEM